MVIVFMVILGGVFTYPWVGALLYMWISTMNPHRLTYGFTHDLQFAMVAAIVTFIALVVTKNRQGIPSHPLTYLLLTLTAWMGVTSYFTLNNMGQVTEQYIVVLKTQFMLFVTCALIHERKTINYFVWVLAGSIAYFGIKGGMFTIITGGSAIVWGPPTSYIEGNNELALALVVVLPFFYYAYDQTKAVWARLAIGFAGLMCIFSVLGSHSRGALIAIVAMAGYLGLKSKRPVMFTIILFITLGVGYIFMPSNWGDRMDTIASYDADASALSRLYTWTMILRMVADRPFLGAGFRLDNPELFFKYTDTTVFGGVSFGPHSIYFQALGEHGYIGLILYLGVLGVSWFSAGRLGQAFAKTEGSEWAAQLCKMIQVSLVGFCVGGAFLGLMHWDSPYYLIGLVLILYRYAERNGVERASKKKVRETAIGLRYGRS